MSRPPFMHSNFFSSLKQVEKRLKVENPCSTTDPTSVPLMPPPPPVSSVKPPSSLHAKDFTLTESLSSPIYLLNLDQQTKQSSMLEDSELPREFLSMSREFSTSQEDSLAQRQSPQNQPDMLDESEDDIEDIELLIQLLHLSSSKEESTRHEMSIRVESEHDEGRNDEKNCCCDDKFYGRVVGVKGPKCQREVERLDTWIRHFENSGGEKRIEPLRLAHLLLAKAAFVSGDDNSTEGLDFPSTIQDFLLNDPPINWEKK